MIFKRERDIDLSISPLLPSVPLSGSDKALGLHEINALLRITPPEAEDELPSPPSHLHSRISSLSLSELQAQAKQRCCWVTFAHASMLTPLSMVYSVPGSVPVLLQRVNSNLFEFLVRFPACIVFFLVGPSVISRHQVIGRW